MRGIVWLAWGVVALLIAVAAVLTLRGAPDRSERPEAARRPATAPAPPPAASATPAAHPPGPAFPAPPSGKMPSSDMVSPSFDIVSVDRSGQAVVAGRAMPGDRVRVLDGERPIGEVTADARGEWVLVPEAPIPAGNRQLGIEAASRDGGPIRRSPDVVALSVNPPASAQGETTALAVLLPGDPSAPARLLQRPEPSTESQPLLLDTAEYGAQDQLLLSGSAAPGARLTVHAGERLLGTAVAGDDGKWSLKTAYRQPTGGVELRLEQLAADGSVARRIAAPFNLPAGLAVRDGATYVVERGNSLWVIARRIYGRGNRYTAIYQANREQIRDPHRIYPGQEFKLPEP